jgi:hypothetical protein
MEQIISWDDNIFSANYDISNWNQKIHYPAYESLPFVLVLDLKNQIHALLSYIFDIKFNNISLSAPICGKFHLSLRFIY